MHTPPPPQHTHTPRPTHLFSHRIYLSPSAVLYGHPLAFDFRVSINRRTGERVWTTARKVAEVMAALVLPDGSVHDYGECMKLLVVF